MDVYVQALRFLFQGILFVVLCAGLGLFAVYMKDVFTEEVENDRS